MKAGLLGAIGGLGKAMETVGTDIMARREKALAEAQAQAKYERDRAAKLADKADDREFTTTRDATAQAGRVALATTMADRTDARQTASQNFRSSERVAGQNFKVEERKATLADRKELATLTSRLAGSNQEAGIRLREKLSSGDVRGVTYGAPDAEGRSPVFAITKAGVLVDTGQRLRRPPPAREGAAPEEALPPPVRR